MRACSGCGQTKPLDEFTRGSSRCKRCKAAYARKWRQRHLPRINQENRERYHKRYKDDPEYNVRHWWRMCLKKHGLTKEDYERILKEQGGGCAICGRKEDAYRGHKGDRSKRRRMPIDHDHRTGKVRGILCSRCNIVLGWIENAELFARMQSYLHNPK